MNKIVFIRRDKYSIFKGFLNCLRSLANKEKQVNAWVKGNISAYTDFSEIYMCFSDACEPILTWHELSTSQRYNLQLLYDMVENYDRNYKTDAEICNDPKWDEVRTFAKKVYDDLKNVQFVEG